MDDFSQLEKYYNSLLTEIDKYSIIFWFIPILFAVWKKNELNVALRLYFYYSLTHLGLHILEHIHIWTVINSDPYWELMKSINIKDSTFFNIFYRLTAIFFIGKFYKAILKDPFSKIAYKATWLFIFFAILIFCFIDGYNQFGLINLILVRIFLIIVPIIFLSQLYGSTPNVNLWKNSYFLISQSLIISNVLSLLFALVAERIHYTDFVLYAKLSMIRNIISILTDLLVAYAFYQARYVKFLK